MDATPAEATNPAQEQDKSNENVPANKKGLSVSSKFQTAKAKFAKLSTGIKKALINLSGESPQINLDAEKDDLAHLSEQLEKLDIDATNGLNTGNANTKNDQPTHNTEQKDQAAANLPIEQHITKLEQELGIETEGQRFLETMLLIDGKFIRTGVLSQQKNLERMFGDNEWADWLAARAYSKKQGNGELTVDFIKEIHKQLTQRTNPNIGGKIRSVGIIGGDYKKLGSPLTYSNEELNAIKNNKLLSFIKEGDYETSGLIQYPAVNWNGEITLDLSNRFKFDQGQRTRYGACKTTDELINALLKDTCAWYNQAKQDPELNPYKLAAEVQRRFISIHPFGDMNGRTSRLIMEYVLEANGASPSVLYEPSDDILVPEDEWSATVEMGGNAYLQMQTEQARQECIGYSNLAEIFGSSEEEAFYRNIFSHLVKAPKAEKGAVMDHGGYEQFLEKFDRGYSNFRNYYTAVRQMHEYTLDSHKEFNLHQGGLIPQTTIDLLDLKPPSQNEYLEYLNKFYEDSSIYRGGVTAEELNEQDALRIFNSFTAMEAGYLTARNAYVSSVSTKTIPPDAVKKAYQQYNRITAFSYLKKFYPETADKVFPENRRPYDFEKIVINHLRGTAPEPGRTPPAPPYIFDSPFLSTSFSRTGAYDWAAEKPNLIPNQKSGVLIRAKVPRHNIVLGYGNNGTNSPQSDIRVLSTPLPYPHELEVMIPGAINPASISEITFYTYEETPIRQGLENLKAIREVINGEEYIKIDTYSNYKKDLYDHFMFDHKGNILRDTNTTWYKRNNQGRYVSVESPEKRQALEALDEFAKIIKQ